MPDLTTYPSPTSAELRARLDARTRSIQGRVAALQRELTTVTDVTVGGRPIPEALRERPLFYAGLGLVGGLALGLLTGLRTRVRRRPSRDEPAALVRLYVADLLDDAARHVAKGRAPDEAVAKAMRRRPPPISYAPPSPAARSTLAETFDVAFKTAAGFAVKTGLDFLAKRYTHKDELFSAVKEVKENPTV
jgi:hypothetical protein